MSANLQKRGGRGGRRTGFTQMSEINVTPFVDVMLVLLIVFMVTAPLLTAGVQVDLPDNQASPITSQDSTPLEVSINKAGKIFIGETEVGRDKLVSVLQTSAKENVAEQRIFVRGDKGVAYGDIMSVIGLISEAGFTQIALVSLPVQN